MATAVTTVRSTEGCNSWLQLLQQSAVPRGCNSWLQLLQQTAVPRGCNSWLQLLQQSAIPRGSNSWLQLLKQTAVPRAVIHGYGCYNSPQYRGAVIHGYSCYNNTQYIGSQAYINATNGSTSTLHAARHWFSPTPTLKLIQNFHFAWASSFVHLQVIWNYCDKLRGQIRVKREILILFTSKKEGGNNGGKNIEWKKNLGFL